MTGDVKAIETVYNGYRFRSRLEARWAVFFDEIGVDYEYEPEGLVLSDGEYYLPDFFLKRFHCYFEVKRFSVYGTEEADDAIKKISDGCRTNSWAGIIAFGDPYRANMFLYCQCISGSSIGNYDSAVVFGKGEGTDRIVLLAENDRADALLNSLDGREVIPAIPAGRDIGKIWPYLSWEIEEAKTKARQARFEHGETPTTK